MRLVYDTEGDGLRDQCTRLWCIVTKDIDTGELYKFGPDDILQGITHLDKASALICHNQIGHDLPIMRRIYGWTPDKRTEIVDTLIFSRAIWPDRQPHPGYKGKSPHSIEAYGVKFRRQKPEHKDWSKYSPEMLHRCAEDVEIQHLTYQFLLKEKKEKGFPDFSLKLEHKVAEIITQQEINGIPFNLEKAKSYLEEIEELQHELYSKVRPYLGFAIDDRSDRTQIEKRRIAKPFSKDGGLSQKLLKLCAGRELEKELIGGPFTYIDLDIGSRQTITRCLYKLGWKPRDDEWNYKKDTKTGKFVKGDNGKLIRTSPKLTDKGQPVASLFEMEGEVGKGLARWYILNHRKSVIKGWVENIRPDGRLTPGANSCGANTSRMQHRTVVNVPKANTDKEGNLIWNINKQSEVYGTQMRSLFTTIPGRVLVGYDASGLEARVMAHYLNDDNLTYEILHGDFHTLIWKTIDEFVASRSNAKNVEYAFIYGAGDSKLGQMADDRKKLPVAQCGAEIRKRINQGIPALGDLTDRVIREARKGYVTAIDGRKLWIRSEHSALNTLFQGTGAIVMKTSMLYLDKWCNKEKIVHEKVLDMHDEAQHLVIPEQAELFGNLAVKAIQQTGQYFKMNCPLDADYKIGQNWAETH